MKPRIAVTADAGARPEKYLAAVEAAGGEPVVFEPTDAPDSGRCLQRARGLLLTGGRDLDPALWGEAKHPKARLMDPRRQASDLALLAEADARRLPVLALCLGAQELAVHRGGALYQHIPDDVPDATRHDGTLAAPVWHEVAIEPGSLLARVAGPEPLRTNSRHHQAVRKPGRGMRVVARAADGMIEAIEGEEPGRFVLGVQWHAEDLTTEPRHRALFEALCARAEAYASNHKGKPHSAGEGRDKPL